MRLILLAAILMGLANACSCLPPGPPEEEMAKSDAVFSGRVASIVKDSFGYVVTFEVERAWKGVEAETLKVRTARDSAACGYAFSEREKYLVYAYRDDDGSFGTGICGRTALLSEAGADLEALGPGTAMTPPKSVFDGGMLVAAAMIIIGLALLAWLLMKK
jgi:hypothetical protein